MAPRNTFETDGRGYQLGRNPAWPFSDQPPGQISGTTYDRRNINGGHSGCATPLGRGEHNGVRHQPGAFIESFSFFAPVRMELGYGRSTLFRANHDVVTRNLTRHPHNDRLFHFYPPTTAPITVLHAPSFGLRF